MLRQALVIVVVVALLVGLGLLAFGWLGWLPHQKTPVPETAKSSPSVNVPVVPAEPLGPPPETPPDETPIPTPEVQRTQPAPIPPEPKVVILPQPPVKKPAPAPPTPQVRVLPPQSSTSTRLESGPLTALNAVRALAKLPPVKAEAAWQAECVAHAQYLTVTDTGSHSEDTQNPHYTAAGAACAHGHYFITMRPEATAAQAITYWQNGPFHLPQLLDPRLARAALAVRHDSAGGIHTAVVLDVKRGRDGQGTYPVKFPAPGSTIRSQELAQFEYPDPLPGCPGYTHPAGAPIVLLLGYGQVTHGARLQVNGQAVDSCLLTVETFSGSSDGETRVGRSVLNAQGVAAVVPRQPLPANSSVNVTFQTAPGTLGWSFHTR